AAELLVPCLGGYLNGGQGDAGLAGSQAGSGPAVHDVVAVAQVAHPELLGCRRARVDVETAGQWSSGMTVTDFQPPPPACNALVATTIDVPAFWNSILDTYSRIALTP